MEWLWTPVPMWASILGDMIAAAVAVALTRRYFR